MKNILTILASVAIILSLASSCKKEKMPDALPPITMEGKGTFGCKINGEIWIPKTQDEFLGNNFDLYSAWEATPQRIFLLASKRYGDFDEGFAVYIWRPTMTGLQDTARIIIDFQNRKTSLELFSNLTVRNLTKLEISRFDMTNRIASGTFEGVLIKESENDTLRITEGRFDVRI
ncbi:MAG: hypothetical protein IPO14_00725 [Saprospiraceae bacterium]|nr:hypothetical protein [Saprospiraceae bacterium]